MRSMQRYIVLASALLLAACGSDDKDSTGPVGAGDVGAFNVTVGGDATGSLKGFAVHASVPQSSQQDGGFALALSDTTKETGGVVGSLIIGKVNPALPTTGTHQIAELNESTGDNDYFAVGIITDEDATDWICWSTGGTLTVQQSSAARLKGSIALQATCQQTMSDVTANVTFSGSYDSKGGVVTAPAALLAQRAQRVQQLRTR